jgi:hypothetical protein
MKRSELNRDKRDRNGGEKTGPPRKQPGCSNEMFFKPGPAFVFAFVNPIQNCPLFTGQGGIEMIRRQRGSGFREAQGTER